MAKGRKQSASGVKKRPAASCGKKGPAGSCVKKRPAAKRTVFAKKKPAARLLKKKPAACSVEKKPAAAIKNKQIKQNEIMHENIELGFHNWLQAVNANQMPSRFAFQVARHLNNVAGLLVNASNIQHLIDEAASEGDQLMNTVGSVPAHHLIEYMAYRLAYSFGHSRCDWYAELRFIYDHA